MDNFIHPSQMTADQRLAMNLDLQERLANAMLRAGSAKNKATAKKNLAKIADQRAAIGK